jgi:hypothetical protein
MVGHRRFAELVDSCKAAQVYCPEERDAQIVRAEDGCSQDYCPEIAGSQSDRAQECGEDGGCALDAQQCCKAENRVVGRDKGSGKALRSEAAQDDRAQADDTRSESAREKLGRSIFELKTREAGVETFTPREARVRTFFDDLALVHHDDAIGGANGRETVGNDDRRAMLHQPVERILHQPLALGIERGRRFVEKEQGGVA